MLLVGISATAQSMRLETPQQLRAQLTQFQPNDTAKVSLLCALAYKHRHDTTQAAKGYAQRALQLAQQQRNAIGQIQAYIELIRVHYLKKEFSQAYKYEKKGLTLLPLLPSIRWKSAFFAILHRLYMARNILREKALLYSLQATRMLDSAGTAYQALKVVHLVDIGEFMRESDNPRALKYLREAIAIANKSTQTPVTLAKAYNRMAACYSFLKKDAQVFVYIRQSLKVCSILLKRYPHHDYLLETQANNWTELSGLYNQPTYYKPDSSIYYAKKSLAVRKQLKLPTLPESYIALGFFAYEQKKDETQAIALLDTALSISHEPSYDAYIHDILAQIYRTREQYKQEAFHREQATIARTSATQHTLKNAAQELNFKYETELKDQQIETAKAKSKAQQQEIKQKQLLNQGFALGALLLLGFVAYFVYANRQTKKKNQLLSSQKGEIETQTEELRVINEQLTELSQFKADMTAMMVHDLKNPLTTIIGLTQGTLPNKQQQQSIHQAGNQMYHLVMNMLDVHRFEEAVLVPKLEAYNLNYLLKEACAQVAFLAAQKEIELQLPNNQSLSINADPDLMLRVLVNILNNAIKYSPVNTAICIDVTIAKKSDKMIEISISDEGVGIAPEKQQAIFEKFRSIDKRHQKGSTGLGLTFAMLAVQAHQGEIWVTSDKGKGSSFFITLPKADTMVAADNPQALSADIPATMFASLAQIPEVQACVQQLRQLDICEVSNILAILQQVTHLPSPEVQQWKEQVEQAMYVYNEPKYEELISLG